MDGGGRPTPDLPTGVGKRFCLLHTSTYQRPPSPPAMPASFEAVRHTLLPPFAISPPLGRGDRHFTVLLGNIYNGGLCSPSVTHTFLHCFPTTSNQSPVCIL